MKSATRRFLSSNGEHVVSMRIWFPKGEPTGILQIIHGMREHIGRYRDFAAYLNAQGFVVCGHDHLGHGETARDKDDFGYFGKDNGMGYLLADCKRVSKLICRDYPGIPFFLLGHSMGSFLGRLYILQPPVELHGFICIGTGGEVKAAPVSRAAFEIAARVMGERSVSPFLNRLVISPGHAVDRRKGSDWLSRDKAVVTAYDEDPFISPLFTNRGICDLVTLQMAATSANWARRVNKALPILLMSGDDDVIGGKGGRGVVQTYERLRSAGCNVQCSLYEEARHELLNEINKEVVYYDILTWMNQLEAGPLA